MFPAILRIYCERKKESEDPDQSISNWLWRSFGNCHEMKERNHGIVFIEKLQPLIKDMKKMVFNGFVMIGLGLTLI